MYRKVCRRISECLDLLVSVWTYQRVCRRITECVDVLVSVWMY